MTSSEKALFALRVVVSVLLAIHGWARWLNDAVAPFGTWLNDQGVPFGLAIAVAITAFEILSTPVMAFSQRAAAYLAPAFAAIYLVGLVMVHLPEGWFVVGLGRGGMEYSVLLITCLLGIAYASWAGQNLE